jgi:YYY domain-containing protein
MVDVLLWYLLIQVTGLLGFLLVFKLLPHLPDRGYGFAKPAGLLVWSYIFWLLCSLHIVQNTQGGIFATFLVAAALAGWAYYLQKQEITAWVKKHVKTIITAEVIFLLAFVIWTLMRAASPDIAGTEKPMEMAFINSILRSETFPPFDPWLSGYAISYYYFGYVMVALMIKVTGILPSIAFNLAIALWFGMTAMGANSILYALLYHWRKKADGEEKASLLAMATSWLAPVFILLVSNYEGFLQMLHHANIFWTTGPDGTAVSPFWTWLNIQEINVPPTPPYSFNPASGNGWWFWRASRVVQDFNFADPHFKNYIEVIDEFPFFTYYLADLHPHLLSMPFVLLVIALGINLYFGRSTFFTGESFFSWASRLVDGQKPAFKELRLFRNAKTIEFWSMTLLLGGLVFLNTWDFPIYTGFICLVVLFVDYEKQGWNWGMIGLFLETGLELGLIGMFFYIPFFIGFTSQAGGFLPSLIFFTRGTFFWVMFGVLMIPILGWLVWMWLKQGREGFPWQGLRAAAIVVFGLWILSYALAFIISLVPVYGNMFMDSIQGAGGANFLMVMTESIVRRLTNFGTWFTLFVMITLLWELLPFFSGKIITRAEDETEDKADEKEPGRTPSVNVMVIVLIIMGIGLTLMPEFFYLRDQFGTRMNTIFKFYFEAWIIWGLAAAYCMVVLFSQKDILARLFVPVALVSMAMGLVIPATGFSERFVNLASQKADLNGASYITRYSPDDTAAINWLEQAPTGVLVEAVGGDYTDFARYATFSGQPSILGWVGHESQWRGGAKEMGTRQADIEKLYRTGLWQEAQSILSRYHVRYVMVGSRETGTYQANTAKFQGHLMPAFQNGAVTIFEVPANITNAPEAQTN